MDGVMLVLDNILEASGILLPWLISSECKTVLSSYGRSLRVRWGEKLYQGDDILNNARDSVKNNLAAYTDQRATDNVEANDDDVTNDHKKSIKGAILLIRLVLCIIYSMVFRHRGIAMLITIVCCTGVVVKRDMVQRHLNCVMPRPYILNMTSLAASVGIEMKYITETQSLFGRSCLTLIYLLT